jgi:N-acyl-D-aspartate/D-glutamate deacylase
MGEVSIRSGRPLTFSMMQSNRRPDLWAWVMGEVAALRARGADVRPQTAVRGSAIVYGLVGRTPYDHLTSWSQVMSRPLAERLAALRDPETRSRLVAEAERPVDLTGPLAPKDAAKMYLLPPGPARYDVSDSNSLAAEAARRGVSAPAAFIDYTVETGGRGLLYYPVLNQDMDAVAQMIANPDVVVGVADAGAHVALTMDAGNSTYFLAHWVRDQGLLDIGRAIHKLTLEGARLFGIADRGLIAEGAQADVNVIDLDGLDLFAPEMVDDLPRGASRFVQRASGYDCTIVNGAVLVDQGELTEERGGQLLRAG